MLIIPQDQHTQVQHYFLSVHVGLIPAILSAAPVLTALTWRKAVACTIEILIAEANGFLR